MGEGTYVTKQNTTSKKAPSFRLGFDVPFLLIVIVLLVFGLLMVYSASWDFSIAMGQGPTYLFGRQVLWVLLGLVGATVTSLINYHFYQKFLVPMWFGTLLLLLAVLIVNEGSSGDPQRLRLDSTGGATRNTLNAQLIGTPPPLAEPRLSLHPLHAWRWARRAASP